MKFIPLEQAEAVLGHSRNTIKSWIDRGVIEGEKIKGKSGKPTWAISAETLASLLTRGEKSKPDYETFISQWEKDQQSGYINGRVSRAGTIERKKCDLKAFWHDLNKPESLEAITVENIRLALSRADKTKKARRENIYKTMLTLYKYMVLKGMRPRAELGLFTDFKPEKNKNPKRTFINDSQADKLISTNRAWIKARTEYDVELTDIFILIAYHTGMRNSEVCQLRFEDIDLVERVIHIISRDDAQTKTGDDRSVGMSKVLHAGLLRFIACRPPHPSNRLLIQPNGKAVHYRIFTKRIRMLSKRANIKIKPHGFRASLITQLLREGKTVAQVQKITGHKQLRTLQLYDQNTSMDALDLLRDRDFEPEKPAEKAKKKKRRPLI